MFQAVSKSAVLSFFITDYSVLLTGLQIIAHVTCLNKSLKRDRLQRWIFQNIRIYIYYIQLKDKDCLKSMAEDMQMIKNVTLLLFIIPILLPLLLRLVIITVITLITVIILIIAVILPLIITTVILIIFIITVLLILIIYPTLSSLMIPGWDRQAERRDD